MHPVASSIEPLEVRIAPATLLPGGKVATFTDIDGDAVTVKFSKPILTAANVSTIFQFTGSTFASTGPQKLNTLQLASLGADANGVNISISARRSPVTGGNGFVDLSGINASDVSFATGTGSGIDLGKVTVRGNIDFIDAGDANLDTPALRSTDLITLGAATDGITSAIYGGVGTFKVRGSMLGNLVIDGFNDTPAQTTLKSLVVGGSIGPGFDSSLAGHVDVAGNLVAANIRRDLHGGDAPSTGSIEVSGDLGRLRIGGSIIGGTLLSSGVVLVGGKLSSFFVGGDIVGDTGPGSGFITAKSVGTGFIAGDIRGYKDNSLGVQSLNATINATQSIDSVTIGGSLIAGSIVAGIDAGADEFFGNADDADLSGGIVSRIGKIIIRGNVHGTASAGDSFGIEANQIAMVRIGSVTYLPNDPLLSFSTGVVLSPTTGDIKLRTL